MSSETTINPNLKTIRRELAAKHGIERSQELIWWAIYNDANRDAIVANFMADEIATNSVAMESFAKSMASFGDPAQVITYKDSGNYTFVASIFFLLGACVGAVAVTVGVML